MSVVDFDRVKELREVTSCGIMDCKKALEQASGDMEQAKEILMKRGLEIAAKKGSRTAKEGRVEVYVHMGNKLAVLVEVNCETDFVARNEDFCQFAKDVAMHIAATNPSYIKEADIPEDILASQKDKNLFLKEQCLLAQPFVKDPSKTIQDYLNTLVAKIGENILISRFERYRVGEVE
ncbi:MAG: translation elongation factor Ts [Candidatus Omnitrophica bacterium]|nr:translation elongation factor Ts [Candidatus Omnitrophota bacterium]